MRRHALLVCLAGLLVLAIAACGAPGSTSATITMGASSFTGTTTITIVAGGKVTFDDSSGGTHNLVTGTNGKFAAAAGAPSEFASATGLTFNPGDKKTITFAHAGTYQITCTIHPSMQVMITVSAAGGMSSY